MDCCAVEDGDSRVTTLPGADEPLVCMKCQGQGQPVSRKTILLTVKPEFLEEALNGTYGFCQARECPVVYFEKQQNRVFMIEDLRTAVGIKPGADPIPLCYCFGFDENHLREEISQTGTTTIPERISRLIREGLCACDVRNPSGKCCLGEVNKAAERLRKEAVHQV